ncbi:MAG TPA: hypothetical protein VLZ81_12970, partial [Blastocatellia bacterium]|nr:hypothetical protein [Blastocatellia bacterium]
MRTSRVPIYIVCVVSVASITGCKAEHTAQQAPVAPAAARLASDADATEGAIRFLEARVKLDSEDHIAYNKLAAYYLQRMRETGSITYLDLAAKSATASLNVLPPEHNTDGLTQKAQVEYAEHNFAGALDDAKRL